MRITFNPTDNTPLDLAQYLIAHLPRNKEITVVGIGTDKVVGDSFGCLTSTLIQEICESVECRGTFEDLFHGRNIKEQATTLDSNKFVLALDACLSSEDEEYSILLRDKPIRPRSGMGVTSFPTIGDMSIAFLVGDDSELLFEKHHRLGVVYKACKFVSQAFKIYEEHTQKGEIA